MRITLFVSTLLVSTSALAAPPDRAVKPVAVATQAARIESRPYGWQGASQLFSYAPGGLYQVYAAVGQVTDIMLQEGETLSDTGAVAAGDTVRWVIGEASSGTGPTRRTHILVKPTDPGLKTNLVINTDRRTYHVEVRSTPATYMASVGWSYPQDELIAVKARIEAAGQLAATQVQVGIDPAKLDFSYRLSGDNPPWRPMQVFDDGAKTYLLFRLLTLSRYRRSPRLPRQAYLPHQPAPILRIARQRSWPGALAPRRSTAGSSRRRPGAT